LRAQPFCSPLAFFTISCTAVGFGLPFFSWHLIYLCWDELTHFHPWVRQLEAAMAAGKPMYLRCLDDDDPATRDAAGYLLALLKRASLNGPTDGITDAIWDRLERERDERVQTGLLLAFGTLCEANELNRDRLLANLTKTNSKAVRLSTALALMRLMPENPAQGVLATVIEAVGSPDGYDALTSSIWRRGLHGLHSLAIEHLLFLAPKPASLVKEALTEKSPAQPLDQALGIARVLLAMAFREPLSKKPTFSSLTEQQQRVVKLIAANDNCWIRNKEEDICTVSLPLLGSYGLPCTAAALRALVKAGKTL